MTQLSDYKNKYRYFRLERDDEGVLTVTFHTDGKSMVWGLAPLEELGWLWADVAADRDNKVVIVTGTGEAFIDQMAVSVDMSALQWDEIAESVRRAYLNQLAVEVPMIAAVNGPARYHSEQALLCDIVIAVETTELQDVAHFTSGLAPGDGAQIIYTALLGINRARYFHFMGRAIGAEEAVQIGLIAEVVEKSKLLDRAREIASHILSQPELTRRYSRQILTDPLKRACADYLDKGLALQGLSAWGAWGLQSNE